MSRAEGDLVVYKEKKKKSAPRGYKQNGITLTPMPLVRVLAAVCLLEKAYTRTYYFRFTRRHLFFFFYIYIHLGACVLYTFRISWCPEPIARAETRRCCTRRRHGLSVISGSLFFLFFFFSLLFIHFTLTPIRDDSCPPPTGVRVGIRT